MRSRAGDSAERQGRGRLDDPFDIWRDPRQPLRREGLLLRAGPYAGLLALGVGMSAISAPASSSTVDIVAVSLFVLVVLSTVVLPWDRWHGVVHTLPAFALIPTVALLGGSLVSAQFAGPMLLLPMIWIGAYGSRRLVILASVLNPIVLIASSLAFGSPASTLDELPFIFCASVFIATLGLVVSYAVATARNQRNNLTGALAELEQSNEALMLSEEKFRIIAEDATDVICRLNADGTFRYVSPAVKRLLGYEADELIGQRLLDFTHPEDVSEIVQSLELAHHGDKYVTIRLRFRDKAGKYNWLEATTRVLTGSHGELVEISATVRDISERLALETKLRTASEAKGRFLANISHEIRTPMNAVVGLAEILGEGELDFDQRRYVETISRSADDLLKLINNVLDMSRIEEGGIELVETVFSPPQMLRDVVAMFEPLAAAKHLQFEGSCGSNVPTWVTGDSGLIKQVVVNLTNNAVKFTEQGEVELALRSEPGVVDGGCELTFIVRDTGPGVGEQEVEQMFAAFVRGQSASHDQTGTGLGLAISRELARLLGGEISVNSSIGRGSEFVLRLALPTAEPPPDADVESAAAGGALDGMRVLVAEDNPTNRQVVELMLAKLPITVALVENGEEAVAAVADREFDVVLMDVQMPVLDGLGATQAIRRLPIRQPVVVALTASAFDEDRERCMAAGMDDFLTKPLKRGPLVAAMERAQRRLLRDEPGSVPING